MKELIVYICQIFSLEIKSEIALLDMENDIGAISDHAEYLRYLKNSFNLSDIQYLTAYQKFLTLTKRYKESEASKLNQEKLSRMAILSQTLSDKVRAIDTIVLNNQGVNHEWNLFKADSKEFFSDKEQKALSSIGSPLVCIRLQRKISGRDLLAERLEALFIERLTHTQQIGNSSVTALLTGINKI